MFGQLVDIQCLLFTTNYEISTAATDHDITLFQGYSYGYRYTYHAMVDNTLSAIDDCNEPGELRWTTREL